MRLVCGAITVWNSKGKAVFLRLYLPESHIAPVLMSVTRLKRKHRKNIARANNETAKIKNLLRTPVLKNVDIDELKARFAQSAPTAEAEAEKKSLSLA